ncbi:hypothetical protein RND71_026220 [Anisodus tanguticus]|uniref:Uncharacterized protein n=1 Tax=Anisodus tanguticus TaxID=243964 RepID=A0AAE1V859_9SOLA|nr:hypothetical protein RND71_026220 [Anisodus tanguticus]
MKWCAMCDRASLRAEETMKRKVGLAVVQSVVQLRDSAPRQREILIRATLTVLEMHVSCLVAISQMCRVETLLKKLTIRIILIESVSVCIGEIYGLGGRTFLVLNLAPIVCYPMFLSATLS